MDQLKSIIENAFEIRAEINPKNAPKEIKDTVDEVLNNLNNGSLRVATRIKDSQEWETHQWIKKAVLLSFRLYDNEVMKSGYTNYFDKVNSKFANFTDEDFKAGGYRVVPNAIARVGIGGVLEPIQAGPTIIGDNCFIGARSEVVEGVVVEDNAVISMGVYIGQSTKIYDRETGEVTYGRIPKGSVVVSGNLPSKDGSYSLYCAVIVKKVDEKTLGKVGINELLRGI